MNQGVVVFYMKNSSCFQYKLLKENPECFADKLR